MAETLREIQAVRAPSSAGDADLASPPRRPRRWPRVVLVLVLLAGGGWIARQAQQNRAFIQNKTNKIIAVQHSFPGLI